MRYVFYTLLGIIVLAIGVGISVSPGTFIIQDIPVGVRYDITSQAGYRIKIGATSSPGYYIITPRRPSDDGTRATGYYDFPNPEWFHTEYCTIYVAPDTAGHTAMWISLPDDPGLYNRHFLLGVDVSPMIENTRGMIAVGAYLLFRFETEPKEDVVPTLQTNEIVFVPSVVKFDSLGVGDNISKTVRIFSDEANGKNIKLYRLDPKSDVAQITIRLSLGYARAPEGMVLFPEQIKVDNGSGKLFVQVAIAEKMKARRMEELIIAEAPNGNKAFLRVKITRRE